MHNRRQAGGLILASFLLLTGCTDSPTRPTSGTQPTYTIIEVRPGTGAEAVAGSAVTISYTLSLFDQGGFQGRGAQVEQGTTAFAIGSGTVIEGLSVGIRGMKVGGRRTLIVPSQLAFGQQGRTGVPPNRAVVFDIDLLAVAATP